MTNKTAFIAVDPQNDYLPKGLLGVPGSDGIIGPLVDYATIAADVLIVSRNIHPSDHLSFNILLPPNCIKGTSGAKIVPEVVSLIAKKENSYVITKGVKPDEGGFSAFEGGTLRPLETLEEILEREKITHVTVGGYWLEHCVSQTAFDANALGYSTAIDLAASFARDPNEISRVLNDLEKAGILYA